MKRKFTVLSAVLIFTLLFGVVNASAKGNELSNDKFRAVIPENFGIVKDGGYGHY